MPTTRTAIRMTWSSLLFLHWPVPESALRPLIPESLEIDTFDDMAWVGLVPFTMPQFRPPWLPRVPVAGITAFHECNVRTYIRVRGEPAVWFFSLDAASRLAVWGARRFWSLPYHHARIDLHEHGQQVRYETRRVATPDQFARFQWTVGDRLPLATPGSLEHFLTERYSMTARRGNHDWIGRIEHEPWKLHAAELNEFDETLLAANNIDRPNRPPIVLAAESIDVNGFPLQAAAD